ncbi:MAG: hypothetical protein QOH99_892, partial [Frankiaceae bacterium]|nr:hypothetical protein [Frankiaceae bacterium]
MLTYSAVTPTSSVVSDLQMLVAGLAAVMAGQQFVLAHMDRDRTARWLGAVTATMACTLAANVAVLQLPEGSWFEVAMVSRAVADSAFGVAAVFLFGALAGRRPPIAVLAPALALAGLRVALWPTDLVFAHRVEHGGPVYGPLLTPLTVPLLVTCLAYFAWVVVRARSNVELIALIVGAGATAAIAVPSFLVGPALAEELTGWLTVPTVFTSLFVVLRRQYGELEGRRRVLGRQAALASLARAGLTAPAHALIGDATRLLEEHADADTAFATAVSDLTEIGLQRQRAAEDLEYRANHDSLTGLPNRERLTS